MRYFIWKFFIDYLHIDRCVVNLNNVDLIMHEFFANNGREYVNSSDIHEYIVNLDIVKVHMQI